MAFRGHKKSESFHRKLQLLRSITHSHAKNEASIVSDASSYIRQMKQKLEKLNQDIETSGSLNLRPRVTVEALDKGFMVVVKSGESCSGLLVCILEAFEELGLHVLEARASCVDCFCFQALGGENEDDADNVDAGTVELAITNAIESWRESVSQHD